MKLSNKFTLVRIFFAPVFLILYLLPSYVNNPLFTKVTGWIMLPLLAFAEFTDFLDGYYARKRNEVSDFGKIFDPFADVFLHITILAVFAYTNYFNFICLILILYREFTMNFLRMVAAKKGVAIAARKGGKFKTCLYIFTGFVILFMVSAARIGMPLEGNVLAIFFFFVEVLSWLCVLASYVSFIDYVKSFGQLFK